MMKKDFKIGETVDKIPAKIPTKNGEEKGVIVYKRKAIYKEDPYSSTKNTN
ncbi:hypothetical protein V7127_20490 [Bacillus sp. JJ1773]|uniref:hypothetical protein n=1 Tax=Bacillus sp. JJ1773 TaxID=3122965 RepID=UPI00300008E8